MRRTLTDMQHIRFICTNEIEMMDAVTLLKQQAHGTHQWLEATFCDLTSEQAQWAPEGAMSAGAHYAHIVGGQDGSPASAVKRQASRRSGGAAKPSQHATTARD